tara:strand:- start:227 stop:409 length:183 start_codon:yes stop_codon:yes gene_type:complete
MSKELSAFDFFVDDIIETQDNLLKCELDFLLMQHIFNSIDLDNFENYIELDDYKDSYLVA